MIPRGRRRKSQRASRTFRPRFERLEERTLLATLVMTPHDQLLIELINRARQNPAGEAALYGIALNQGISSPDTISSAPKQPLAPNQALLNAAAAHSQDMLTNNYFSHVGTGGSTPSSRAIAAGYPNGAAENIGWGGSTGPINQIAAVYERHRQLFESPSHRINLLTDWYQEIGVGVQYGPYRINNVTYNSTMVTENFGRRFNGNSFVTGVVYTDAVVTDNFFTIGEQLVGVTIAATNLATHQTYVATSGPSGGYAIAVPHGTYRVTASGGEFGQPMIVNNVSIAGANQKIDFQPMGSGYIEPTAVPEWVAINANATIAIDILANDVAGDGELQPSTVQVTEPPAHGHLAIDASSGVATYQVTAGFSGLDQFRYIVADHQGVFSNEALVTIIVNPQARTSFTNSSIFVDVNGDQRVTAQDVLVIVNYINQHGSVALPLSNPGSSYVDLDGNGRISPLDVLVIISFLNRFGSIDLAATTRAAGGEGEQVDDDPSETTGEGEFDLLSAEWCSFDPDF